jgi:hypothetical protein
MTVQKSRTPILSFCRSSGDGVLTCGISATSGSNISMMRPAREGREGGEGEAVARVCEHSENRVVECHIDKRR